MASGVASPDGMRSNLDEYRLGGLCPSVWATSFLAPEGTIPALVEHHHEPGTGTRKAERPEGRGPEGRAMEGDHAHQPQSEPSTSQSPIRAPEPSCAASITP